MPCGGGGEEEDILNNVSAIRTLYSSNSLQEEEEEEEEEEDNTQQCLSNKDMILIKFSKLFSVSLDAARFNECRAFLRKKQQQTN